LNDNSVQWRNNDKLDDVIDKQIEIINSTDISRQKNENLEELAKQEISQFQIKSKKYGTYLKLIQTEFFTIDDLIHL
jgi:predicted negative regulator of RcsB-dependent stress response